MACLDIPIPKNLARLVQNPPFCRPRIEDIQVLDLIRKFGQDLDRPNDEIEQALNLASRPSDVMVILERPREKHPYSASFDAFVQDCETLRAVNELIQFASNGTRSIHTVTVVDAYTFKPHVKNNMATKLPTSEQCHELLEQIVKLKAPESLLCCWKDKKNDENGCNNAFVRGLMSAGVGTWPILDRVELVAASRSSTLVRSFHPSYAVCHNEEKKVYARMLLVCHFVLAFAALSGLSAVPEWMRAICNGSSVERGAPTLEAQRRGLPQMSIMGHIRFALQGMLGSRVSRVILHTKQTSPMQYNADINDLVIKLLSLPYADGSLELARLCLRWRDYKQPQKKEIQKMLIDLGSEQEWFQSPKTEEYQAPRIRVCFADESDDEELANGLRPLGIDVTHLGRSDYDEEKEFWTNHENTLILHMKDLELFDKLSVKLLSDIDLRLRLSAVLQRDAARALGLRAVALTKEHYSLLHKAIVFVTETPTLLCDRLGIHHGEERPQRAHLTRPDARRLLSHAESYTEPMFHLTTSCLMHLSTLLIQARLLCAASGATADEDGNETVDTLCEISTSPELMRKLNSSLNSMFDLEKQLGSGGT
ncbi:hypothetical protein BB8028_0001g03240 [Beauveria bassiana]|uniref:Uncharacterized protein n=1 Tax=Beauveria bassiana TaxID=176275 RepID=A0A2S7XWF7_BEABA|nr:hypothetical protein BB8028_0001g03240 [Beauveria bassiana]